MGCSIYRNPKRQRRNGELINIAIVSLPPYAFVLIMLARLPHSKLLAKFDEIAAGVGERTDDQNDQIDQPPEAQPPKGQ